MSEFGRGITFRAPITPRHGKVLPPEAVAFIVELKRAFNSRRKKLLNERVERQARLDAGERPDFHPETQSVRDAKWTVAPLPSDLLDRRVEITGQLWQWVSHDAKLSDGRAVTAELCGTYIDEELARAKAVADAHRYQSYEEAAALMRDLIDSPKFRDFLALPAYEPVEKLPTGRLGALKCGC